MNINGAYYPGSDFDTVRAKYLAREITTVDGKQTTIGEATADELIALDDDRSFTNEWNILESIKRVRGQAGDVMEIK